MGIAGEVTDNTAFTTNITHWPKTDGAALRQAFKMESFQLINDFAAAGYGLCQLQEKDYTKLNRSHVSPSGVKVVIGPGTGMGQGMLCKSEFAPCYEIFPTEGGHAEFSPNS